jgi:CRP-like cAMP-binding protein/tRNA A-37 threonylcarbamoyl transferase component Bud32
MRPFHPSVNEIPGLVDVEPLGSGGMAEIYRARRKKKGRIYAVKVLKDSACTGDECEYAERFERECRTAIALRHPHLIAAYETGKVHGRPYLIMEYIDGLSADRKVRHDGPFSIDDGLRIFAQIADAAAYMHRQGYVHRDIKPSNILLGAEGMAKLSDFGLAKTSDDPSLTLAGGVMGTPHYLAPEQINGRAAVDRRSDIYSLGVTLYFLLIGEPPFKGGSVPVVLTRQLTDALRFPSDWRTPRHRRLIGFITRMTAKSPDDRQPDLDHVLADLAWVEGRAARPSAGTRTAPLPARGKRKPLARPAPAGEMPLPDESRRLVRVAAGRVLFYEDDVADGVYWLLKGRMEVLRGGRRVAVISESKKVLGEMGIVKGTLRSATLRAATDCLVLRIAAEELTGYLAQNPKMMQAILADMAERIELTSARLLRAETALVELRAVVTDIAERLARGDGKPGDLGLLLKTIALDDDASQVS